MLEGKIKLKTVRVFSWVSGVFPHFANTHATVFVELDVET